MAVWKLQRLGRVSAATGEPFAPDTEIVTALFGDEEEVGEDRVRGSGFTRRDFLVEEATDERLGGAFCVWRTRTPPERHEDRPRFDLAMAREFLQRALAEGREDRGPVCLTLALLLARKRRLTIVDQDAATLTCRWPNEKETFVIPAPPVSEADAEVLQQDMMRLFGFGDDAPETASPAGEPPGGGASEADGSQAPAPVGEDDAPRTAADADSAGL